jgi:hypothetical protein
MKTFKNYYIHIILAILFILFHAILFVVNIFISVFYLSDSLNYFTLFYYLCIGTEYLLFSICKYNV